MANIDDIDKLKETGLVSLSGEISLSYLTSLADELSIPYDRLIIIQSLFGITLVTI